MKLLLENWRKYLNESIRRRSRTTPYWVNTIWVSGPISPKLSKALENNYEKSRQYLISCDRDFQSCDANTDFWLKTLFNAGFDVEAVRDGVYNDGDEMIGHDWIVIEENDTEIIIDAAAEQFDTEPYEDKYSEIGWREQGKIVMKEASLSGGWGT